MVGFVRDSRSELGGLPVGNDSRGFCFGVFAVGDFFFRGLCCLFPISEQPCWDQQYSYLVGDKALWK